MFITKQYMTLLNILFITTALYIGVTIFYKTIGYQLDYQEFVEISAQPQSENASKDVKPLSYYKKIETRNLFNTGDQSAKQISTPPQDIVNLEETSLKLKLWGTVTGSPQKAVIEETAKRKQDIYSAGDTIQGAVIKEILREKIILTVNGKDEILAMEKNITGKHTSRSSSSSFVSKASLPADSQQISLERSQIESAINNVNNLMKQAKIRPHFKDGKPDGLTLSRIKRGSIFTKLGLRSGDIITGVDGQQIKSVDDALKFYNSLKSADNVSIEIKRRGQVKNLEYNIE